jgi:hypothetical protein
VRTGVSVLASEPTDVGVSARARGTCRRYEMCRRQSMAEPAHSASSSNIASSEVNMFVDIKLLSHLLKILL